MDLVHKDYSFIDGLSLKNINLFIFNLYKNFYNKYMNLLNLIKFYI